MKRQKVFSTAVLFLFTGLGFPACRPKDKVRDFIPGRYVAEVRGPQSQLWDTLILSQEGESLYRYEQRSAYRLNKGSPAQKKKYLLDSAFFRYDPETRQLSDDRERKKLFPLPEKKMLLLGKRRYHKLPGQP